MSERRFKIVMIGNSGVGKTSVVTRITEDTYTDGEMATIGAQFVEVRLRVSGYDCVLETWDTAGQEVYRSLVGFYTREARGAIIVADVTSTTSFDQLGDWLKFVKGECGAIKILLMANKCDMERVVDSAKVRTVAKSHGIEFFEGSALTGERVHECFARMAELLIEEAKKNPEVNVAAPVLLVSPRAPKGKRRC